MNTDANVSGQKHLFIGGLHKSGTSLLSRILADHPQISCFANTGAPEDEGQHLQSVYRPARFHGGPGKFGFSPEAHLTDASPLICAGNRARLQAVGMEQILGCQQNGAGREISA